MMTLLALSGALVGPYVLLTLIGSLFPSAAVSPRTRAKVGVSLVFIITSVSHFVRPDAMAEMLPPWVPARVPIIQVTGVFELLGAVGIWVRPVSRLAGACLILMLIGMLPSNVYAAIHHVPFGGHGAGPAYLLVRVPFQALLIGWVYVATDQRSLCAVLCRGDSALRCFSVRAQFRVTKTARRRAKTTKSH
jgi:uncharacterized membrane protein